MTEKTNLENSEVVKVTDYMKNVLVDLKYSTTDNFTGKVIYNYKDAYLRYGTVKRLMNAEKVFLEKGYRIKIWDAFRTVEAQFVMWEVYPDDDFVADPTKGYSNHSRGNTVDITLVDKDGNEIPMPTAFDDFEAMAKYDYNAENTKVQTENALFLKKVMIDNGFYPSNTEWWHFRDIDQYDVIESQ